MKKRNLTPDGKKRYGQHNQPHKSDKADQQRFNVTPLYQ